ADGAQRVSETAMVNRMFGRVGKNDLASLKTFLDEGGDGMGEYVQDIEYKYGVVPQIFDENTNDGIHQINPDASFAALGIGGTSSMLAASSAAFSTNVFAEMPANLSLVEDQFDVRAGRWPQRYDELVLVLTKRGTLSDFISYAIGLRDHKELERMVKRLADQEDVEAPSDERTYDMSELMGKSFRVVPASSFYSYEPEYNVWTDKSDDEDYMRTLVREGLPIRIVGVVQPKEDVDATTLTTGIYYTPKLTRWLMRAASISRIVREQLKDRTTNVISGKSFDEEASEEGSFDMSKLFSIDETKLTQAFAVDENSLDLSGLDFSDLGDALDFSSMGEGMDFSGMEMPQMDLSQLSGADFGKINLDMSKIDLSKLDLSGIDLSGVDTTLLSSPEVTAAIMPDLSTIDLAKLLEGISPNVDQEKLQPVIAELQAGFTQYLLEQRINPTDQQAVSAAVTAYFSQPEVLQKAIAGAQGAVSLSEQDQQLIATRLQEQVRAKTAEEVWAALPKQTQDQLTEEAKKVVGQIAAKVGPQIAAQVGDQLSKQLGEQISRTLSTSLGTMLESYMGQAMEQILTAFGESLETQLTEGLSSAMEGAMTQLMSNMASAFHIDQDAFAAAFSFNMDEKELSELMMSLMSTERTSYDNNLVKLGYADEAKPSEIDIYPLNFDSKAQVVSILDAYNERMKATDEDKVITYTDIVGALMSSVTDIVNMISYVLIAFVAISLVVSSIMIGVITYISVLERKKEIGILRSIGASKRDIGRVFNAETVIEGLVSGLMGVGITAVACIPANLIVEANFGVHRVARLPITAAVILVGVSVLLSLVAGLIPSRKAAKADPVEALRSE
ncbi:MAG: FtsX-like permease family protein, partial [Coriobacteriales bacterium]|nr:FtsX-like permease family protein [Coriobacteriales bacterium]